MEACVGVNRNIVGVNGNIVGVKPKHWEEY